jgi:hemerythrin-like metal-binding protein
VHAYIPLESHLRSKVPLLKKPEWSSTFDLGVSELDREHRELFRLVGEVRDAIEAKDYRGCHALAGRFIEDLKRHFAHEEAFLDRIRFPGTERHKAYHLQLMKGAEALQQACDLPKDGQLLASCYARMMECLFADVVSCDGEIKSHVDYYNHTDRTAAATEPSPSGARPDLKSQR